MGKRRDTSGSEQETSLALAPGTLLGGRYQLVEVLGAGGMGVVWRAHHQVLEKDVAVKVLPPELGRNAGACERLLSEARRLAKLDHPAICRVTDCGRDEAAGPDPVAYVVMDLLEGPTLKSVLAREGALPPEDAVKILRPLAEALDHAHAQGFVHQDLKPANVMLTAAFAEGGRPRLIDFGLAGEVLDTLEASGESQQVVEEGGDHSGTPAYMSPEQIRGRRPSRGMDVWALAVMTYQVLTDRLPFPGPPAVRMQQILEFEPEPLDLGLEEAEVEEALDEAIRRGLEKRARDRLGSALELVAALEDGLGMAAPGVASRSRPSPAKNAADPIKEPAQQETERVVASSSSQSAASLEGWSPAAIADLDAARDGDPEAQFRLGKRFREGDEVPQDHSQAYRWLHAAAEKGIRGAAFLVAYSLVNAQGVPENRAGAVRWYETAWAEGETNAGYNLGLLYEQGGGLDQDPGLSFTWYQRAAEKGDREAANKCGLFLEQGFGVAVDLENALAWHRQAADQGEENSMLRVGYLEEQAAIEAEQSRWGCLLLTALGLAGAVALRAALQWGGIHVPLVPEFPFLPAVPRVVAEPGAEVGTSAPDATVGQVLVYVEPEEAEVLLEDSGEQLFPAPTVNRLRPGLHRVVARLEGFTEDRAEVEVNEGRASMLRLRLTPLPAVLELAVTPGGAKVYDGGGQYLGRASPDGRLRLELSPGTRELSLVAAGHEKARLTVPLRAGRTTHEQVRLRPSP